MMQESMQASTNCIEFTKTARNTIASAVKNFIQFWESVGRARAAHYLAQKGYTELAKQLYTKKK